MKPYPTLRTEWLILREFTPVDAPEVGRLIGAWEVARTLLVVAHSLEEGWAERFVEDSRQAFEAGERVSFAMVLREGSQLVGDVLLKLNPRDDNAELAYFVGVPFWGRGYATEAVREVVRYGFAELGLCIAYIPTISVLTRHRGGCCRRLA
jgi:RimJ/RimL family protein N-acetyltransferase